MEEKKPANCARLDGRGRQSLRGHVRAIRILGLLIPKPGVHDDFASRLRKLPALERTEGHEVRLIVALQVRKASSIEGHAASNPRVGCGDELRLDGRGRPSLWQSCLLQRW